VKYLLFIFLLSVLTTHFAQVDIQNQVLASAGEHVENSQLALDFTFGETFTATLENGTDLCTQGFHQPEKGSGAGVSDYLFYDVMVFPNPFQTNITLSDPNRTCTKLDVYDLFGKKVFSMAIGGVLTTFSLENLAAGNYQVIVTGENQSSAHYSLIKTENDYE
jgi:hypothetical protein